MTDEEFVANIKALEALASLALAIDLEGLIISLTQALVLGPIVNPTLWQAAREVTQKWVEIAEAALLLQQIVSRHGRVVMPEDEGNIAG